MGCDALPVLKPAEHALDDVAAAIGLAVQWADYISCGPSWDDWLDLSPSSQFRSLSASYALSTIRCRVGLIASRSGRAMVMSAMLPSIRGDGDDPATSIGQTTDFRRLAAARDANRLVQLPPFRLKPSDALRHACCRGRARGGKHLRLQPWRRSAARHHVVPSGCSGCRSSWPVRTRAAHPARDRRSSGYGGCPRSPDGHRRAACRVDSSAGAAPAPHMLCPTARTLRMIASVQRT